MINNSLAQSTLCLRKTRISMPNKTTQSTYLLGLRLFCTFLEELRKTLIYISRLPVTLTSWRLGLDHGHLRWPNRTNVHVCSDVSSPAVLCRSLILLPLTKIPSSTCLFKGRFMKPSPEHSTIANCLVRAWEMWRLSKGCLSYSLTTCSYFFISLQVAG